MASTRIPVLNFHGNGSVVCLEGLKPQATSSKLQAKRDLTGALPGNAESTVASYKLQAINETVPYNDIEEASSTKHQACDKLSRDNSPLDTSSKRQASSYKRQASSAT